jgi:methionyl aminopeptidase
MILTRRNPSGITIKSRKELELMREAGMVVAKAKMRVIEAVRPGVTTGELDRIAEDEIIRHGAKTSFKGYTAMGSKSPFKGTICTSINEEIVHGIPGDRALKEGDILSVDVGAIVGGFHGDSAFTVGVGQVSENAQRLIDATRESLKLAIAQVKPGMRVGDVSYAVQSYAEGLGYSVVRQYVGHGIGRALHEEPQIPNYGPVGRGLLLRKGMTIAIEPMLNIGGWETRELEDGWTVVTADGSLSAHFEDTVAITENGAEVLTSPNGYSF